jgi:UDP-GlcNAc3NAcA epimerase
MMKKIVTIVGARPQFIKAAALSRTIAAYYSDDIQEFIIHTGQHYDPEMSEVFFEELNIPKPHFQIEHQETWTEGDNEERIVEICKILREVKPDFVLVYGDTHSTLAGALAASREQIPLIHVEAGLRSYNNNMPEEYNRVKTDQLAQFLFVPTETAIENLAKEGILNHDISEHNTPKRVINCGDIMFDNTLYYSEIVESQTDILQELGLKKDQFILATVHRNFNTDQKDPLQSIFEALLKIAREMPVVLPLHPRTIKNMDQFFDDQFISKIEKCKNLILLEPLSFLDMACLEKHTKMIITDSGGVQKEAYFYQKPSILLRNETEWTEIVETKTAVLTGSQTEKILSAYQHFMKTTPKNYPSIFGDGTTAFQILDYLLSQD